MIKMINKIKEVVEKLNVFEAERLRSEGFTNECFFNSDGRFNFRRWQI